MFLFHHQISFNILQYRTSPPPYALGASDLRVLVSRADPPEPESLGFLPDGLARSGKPSRLQGSWGCASPAGKTQSIATVVLRKPCKDNYTVPKAYIQRALMNTAGEVMDIIVAERPSYLAETYKLQPKSQMGGRNQRSTEHAV